jgi:nucleotide-binding universal stress UspA family protein
VCAAGDTLEPSPRATTFRSVLCGVDASQQSLVAVRQALAIADEDAKYWALSAWDPGLAMTAGMNSFEVLNQLREEARAALRRTTELDPSITPIIMRGRDVPALLAGIANLEADLVAVGSHGTSRPAGIVFGSVASAMAHHAPCSVLIAREPTANGFPGLIVHANDASPESRDAADVAGRLAARYGATAVTLHVGDSTDRGVADEAAALMSSSEMDPVIRIEQGSPHRRIIEVADELGASLIVMGSRGRTGLAALGSVSERVVHRADCSVLIVRRPAHPARDESAEDA